MFTIKVVQHLKCIYSVFFMLCMGRGGQKECKTCVFIMLWTVCWILNFLQFVFWGIRLLFDLIFVKYSITDNFWYTHTYASADALHERYDTVVTKYINSYFHLTSQKLDLKFTLNLPQITHRCRRHFFWLNQLFLYFIQKFTAQSINSLVRNAQLSDLCWHSPLLWEGVELSLDC